MNQAAKSQLCIALMTILLNSNRVFAGDWILWPVSAGGNGHEYKFTDVIGSWNDAQSEAVSLGGYLVSVGDVAENQWVFDTFENAGPNFYIGAWQDFADPAYSEPGGGWKWASGEAFGSYTNWISGEPNNNGDEDWVQMKTSLSTWPGQWNDVGPSSMLRGVIERVPWILWPISAGGNGHLYRFTNVIGTWNDAQSEAETLGGYLVSIGDATENQWVFDTFENSGPNFWIGAWQDNADPDYTEPGGGWKWANCRESVGYTNWISGEPNNNVNEDWVQMKTSLSTWPGQWNDVGISTMHRGVIERDPCPADISGNTIVNVTDLLLCLEAWGPCLALCPANIICDGQGRVNVTDLLALLAAWGPCPLE